MFERILVAVDFSDPSLDALRWTVKRFGDAEITLFHSLESLDAPSYLTRALDRDVDLVLETELDARANLEALAHEHGIEPRIVVRRGWPPRQIRLAAQEADADLIMMGSHRQRMWSFHETGSTAVRTAAPDAPPVYVWRPIPRKADPEDRTILVAIGLHENSGRLVAIAVDLARHFGARLVLCHVVTRGLQAYLRRVSHTAVVDQALASIMNAAREEAQALLPEGVGDELDVRIVVTRGRPWTQILATAEAESANLIIIGTGRYKAEQALLGSVTERVLRASNSSVLAVPPEGWRAT